MRDPYDDTDTDQLDDPTCPVLIGDREVCRSCGHDVDHRDRCTNPWCDTKRDPDHDRDCELGY